ncbi:MAG: coniferyl aldehyde dehydrogenase [Alphaproteobacteria bacterium]|nr:coniferyl aldehyde dehydrogenase [Alphaproteobacteria bacterium]MBU1513201.1 coniferyl aldehyde dehydrogenase [Alphaproteobacteria bacterium]MBU2095309.1 coniferyl aldehyde dehydrogenase [Alphaproteobacteria bacterium]MBU2152224.1 coniferyl aldehyde dehydrogenase [Alphaproteobacteria bacterium]MBU2306729.1 coniferyl aldehyde dehydrogenase [Alphaproteobacteria bacterium]
MDMQGILARQKAAHLRDGAPTAEQRIERLDRCVALLVDHAKAIEDALNTDFGSRSREATAFTDVAASIGPLKHAKAHLARWMAPEKRKTTPAILGLFGAKAEVRYQPKGVVGIISPWNFPVNLTFAPLAGVLAAGNRAMIKPSEFTPATSELMKTMFGKVFSEEEIAVVTGGPELGEAFAHLAFDHLIFTGATSIARHVMRAAADNLVPLTLELGGKSPVILGKSADIGVAAARIMNGKTLNAGQICLAPDYVLAPHDKLDSFVAAAQASVAKMFPTIKDNPDYTSIVAQRHYERITGYIDDARAKGARIVELKPDGEDFSQQEHRKIPPTLILEPTDDMKVMQEEIFGPVLPVKTYRSVDEAIGYVNGHDRPLGLYYFGDDAAEREQVLRQTTPGGVTINDVIFHVAQEELPFGGVGPSGMGSYHGVDGFREFSHRKAIYTQIKKDIGPLQAMRPPYGPAIRKYLAGQLKR